MSDERKERRIDAYREQIERGAEELRYIPKPGNKPKRRPIDARSDAELSALLRSLELRQSRLRAESHRECDPSRIHAILARVAKLSSSADYVASIMADRKNQYQTQVGLTGAELRRMAYADRDALIRREWRKIRSGRVTPSLS